MATLLDSYAPGPGVPLPFAAVDRVAVPKPHFGAAAWTALLDPPKEPPETGGGLYAPGPGFALFCESLFVRARIEYFGWSLPIVGLLL